MDIHCPKCGAEFDLAEEDKGRKVLCPCGLKFIADDPPDTAAKPTSKPTTKPKSAPPSSSAIAARPPPPMVPPAENPPPRKPTTAPNATAPALRGTASRLTTSVTLTRPIQAKKGQRILLILLALLIGVLLALLVYMIMKG